MYVIRPRPGTTFVQTWHASGAFKKFGYSVARQVVRRRPRSSRSRSASTATTTSASSRRRPVAPFYAEAFRQPVERFAPDIGIPRTDVLFDTDRIARTAEAVRRRYGIAADRRVILYAPTFRGDSVGSAVRRTDAGPRPAP